MYAEITWVGAYLLEIFGEDDNLILADISENKESIDSLLREFNIPIPEVEYDA